MKEHCSAPWQRQLQGILLATPEELATLSPAPHDLAALGEVCRRYPAGITPYYAELLHRHDPLDPLAAMVVPDPRELRASPSLLEDPLAEEQHMPVRGLIRRYGDRAVVMATTRCASYCRFCTRKRLAGRGHGALSDDDLVGLTAYLEDHPEVWEILISGGDPLVLSDAALDKLLSALTAVPSVRHLRIATRSLAYLPMRVTDSLVALLRRHRPLVVMTHFNHLRELTEEARGAISRLQDAGIPLYNQTVLLRGVNDALAPLAELCKELLIAGVKPYYLFLPDLIDGTEHLRITVAEALALSRGLRISLSGLAVPTLAVDMDGPPAKLVLGPHRCSLAEGGAWLQGGDEGGSWWYPDPPCGSIR